jgi:hypothetical protein
MPQGDEEAGKVEEALRDGNQAVVADLDAAEVLQPGVGAFDFPAFAESAQLAFVFETAKTVVAAVGSDQPSSFCLPLDKTQKRPGGVGGPARDRIDPHSGIDRRCASRRSRRGHFCVRKRDRPEVHHGRPSIHRCTLRPRAQRRSSDGWAAEGTLQAAEAVPL